MPKPLLISTHTPLLSIPCHIHGECFIRTGAALDSDSSPAVTCKTKKKKKQ